MEKTIENTKANNVIATLQAISDEALLDEVARRVRYTTGFYDKTCVHQRLQAAVDVIHGFSDEGYDLSEPEAA